MSNIFKRFHRSLFKAAEVRGFSDWEVFYKCIKKHDVKMSSGSEESHLIANYSGVSFRGIYNGAIGYSYTEKISDGSIGYLLDNAIINAGYSDESAGFEGLCQGDISYAEVKTYNPDLEALTIEERVRIALNLWRIAANTDPRVIGVDVSSFNITSSFKHISNSYGLRLSQRANYANSYVRVYVNEFGQTGSGDSIWAGLNLHYQTPELMARNAIDGALSMLGAKSVHPGIYRIILGWRDASRLVAAFKDVFSAERAANDLTMLKSRVGENIASPIVTVRDDALLPGKRGSTSFDDEGACAVNKEVIKDGVLKTMLHNTKTANREGLTTTGNGHRESYKSTLGVSPTNLYIQPSSLSKDDLVKEMCTGIIVRDIMGLHAGVNPATGDFSVIARGYLVENSYVTHPLEHFTVTGNFFDVLHNITRIANDLDQHTSCISSPSLLIEGVCITG